MLFTFNVEVKEKENNYECQTKNDIKGVKRVLK